MKISIVQIEKKVEIPTIKEKIAIRKRKMFQSKQEIKLFQLEKGTHSD